MISQFDLLVPLFIYPDESYAAHCRAAGLNDLAAIASSLSTEQLQEQFISAFDWNPATALEIGWHLFGEDYARGGFMARVRADLRSHGVVESTELPDHLTHILALLGRMEEGQARQFSYDFVSLPVAKLVSALERKNSPFAIAMRAVSQALPARAPVPPPKIELPVLQGGD